MRHTINFNNKTTNKTVAFDPKNLSVGECFINAFHDPDNPTAKAGLYMVVAEWKIQGVSPTEHCYGQFNTWQVLNLRSGYLYTWREAHDKFKQHGIYKCELDGINATVIKG